MSAKPKVNIQDQLLYQARKERLNLKDISHARLNASR